MLRYTNRVAALAHLAYAAELDAEEFRVTEALTVFDLELYEALHQHAAVALLERHLGDVGHRSAEKPEHARAKGVFGHLFTKPVAHAVRQSRVAALGRLLPALEDVVTGAGLAYHSGPGPKIRHLSHPQYFGRYFSLTAEGSDVPDEVVTKRWAAVLDGADFGAVYRQLVVGPARSVVADKLISAIDHNPPPVDTVDRIVLAIETLFESEFRGDGGQFVPLPFTSDGLHQLDRVAAHAVAAATLGTSDGREAAVRILGQLRTGQSASTTIRISEMLAATPHCGTRGHCSPDSSVTITSGPRSDGAERLRCGRHRLRKPHRRSR